MLARNPVVCAERRSKGPCLTRLIVSSNKLSKSSMLFSGIVGPIVSLKFPPAILLSSLSSQLSQFLRVRVKEAQASLYRGRLAYASPAFVPALHGCRARSSEPFLGLRLIRGTPFVAACAADLSPSITPGNALHLRRLRHLDRPNVNLTHRINGLVPSMKFVFDA